jgi:hypothetical protein
MQQDNFSPQDSLRLIQSMIDKTKAGFSDRSFYFLLWGWLTVISCLLQYFLMEVIGYERHYQAWMLMMVGVIPSIIYSSRQKKKEPVKSYVNESMGVLWTGIGISYGVLSFIISRIGWEYAFPFFILLYGIGTFCSGGIIQFRPLRWGGAVCFVLAIVASFVNYEYQILITAVSVIVSYLIPGYLLKFKFQKNKIHSRD